MRGVLKMDKLKIDYETLISELQNKAVEQFVLYVMKEEDRPLAKKLFDIFKKHGVMVEEAINIMVEMSKLTEG
jgi:hypothetical protein